MKESRKTWKFEGWDEHIMLSVQPSIGLKQQTKLMPLWDTYISYQQKIFTYSVTVTYSSAPLNVNTYKLLRFSLLKHARDHVTL